MPLLVKRAVILLAILGLAGVLVEWLARREAVRGVGPFAYNEIIAKQTQDVTLFEPDAELGHRLKGEAFVNAYGPGLVTLDDIANDARRAGRRVVLNVGDSSTSGWNSNVVVANAERRARGLSPESPLGTYRTYSDILAADSRLYVINAGVPGYTSLQLAGYLQRLFRVFHDADIHIDWTTIYVGNNDCTWNGNWEDKYLLPNGPSLRTPGLWWHALDRWVVRARVGLADFRVNLERAIDACRAHGAIPIIIEPVVPLYWPPGLRARGLERDLCSALAISADGPKAIANLREATSRFAAAVSGQPAMARAELEFARELDAIVPRIKEPYREALRDLSGREGVYIVRLQEKLPIQDQAYFIDYCHPTEPANALIANALLEVIASSAQKSTHK